jgi:methionyl aminopeptidase
LNPVISHTVNIKSPHEIEAMRRVCALAAKTLLLVGEKLRVGMTTEEIDKLVAADTAKKGCKAAPLGYGRPPFPKHCCTSRNEVVCHGIPSRTEKLRDGDIINVDITHLLDGWHGDTSATFYIGKVSDEARHVTEVSRKALEIGITQVRPGNRIGDIAGAIQEYVEAQGCSVVRDFCGHGIGRIFHELPQIPHFGTKGQGIRLVPGMIFTIEPMVNLGGWEVEILADEWTAVTQDRKLSAQFEHTVLVTDSGCEVLTARSRPLSRSEV